MAKRKAGASRRGQGVTKRKAGGPRDNGRVKTSVQELKKTAQFENARLALGVDIVIPEDETAERTALFGYGLLFPQLALRFDQFFNRTKKTDPGKAASMTAPPGTRVFAGISRLVQTQPFENLRVDAEWSTETLPGETFQEAYDRTFVMLGDCVSKAIQNGTTRDAQESASTFEW